MKDKASYRELKRLFKEGDLDTILSEMKNYPKHMVVRVLFSNICYPDGLIKYRAVKGFGELAATMANDDLEDIRIIMRRFLWSLYEESGQIGWGAGEAMGEILARNPQMASEFASILISFIQEENGPFLEHGPLQRGILWGIGRLAEVNPEILLENDVLNYLPQFLESDDVLVLGLTIKALGQLRADQYASLIGNFLHYRERLSLYIDDKMVQTTIDQLAREALSKLEVHIPWQLDEIWQPVAV